MTECRTILNNYDRSYNAMTVVFEAGGNPDPAQYLTPEDTIELAECLRSALDQMEDFNG